MQGQHRITTIGIVAAAALIAAACSGAGTDASAANSPSPDEPTASTVVTASLVEDVDTNAAANQDQSDRSEATGSGGDTNSSDDGSDPSSTEGPEPACDPAGATNPAGPEIKFEPGADSATVATEPGRWLPFEAAGNQVVTLTADSADAESNTAATLISPRGTPRSAPGEVKAILRPYDDPAFVACVTDVGLTLAIDSAARGLSWRPITIEPPAPAPAGSEIELSGLVFTSSTDPETAATLSTWIETQVAEQFADWLEVAPDGQDRPPGALEVQPQLTLVSDEYVSLRLDTYSSTGAAYPLFWARSVVVDRATGATIDLVDLLTADTREPFDELVTAVIIDEYDLDEAVADSPTFADLDRLADAAVVLTSTGVQVTTGRGELLPPVYPGSSTFLSWADLDGIVAPSVIDSASSGVGVLP
jgi:hypothetical protein